MGLHDHDARVDVALLQLREITMCQTRHWDHAGGVAGEVRFV